MAYTSGNSGNRQGGGGKPQNVPQRMRNQNKHQKYSEKYGSNRPNPYTGYLPPGAHQGGIYHPDAIDRSKLSEIAQKSTGLTESVAREREIMQPRPVETAAPVQSTFAAQSQNTPAQNTPAAAETAVQPAETSVGTAPGPAQGNAQSTAPNEFKKIHKQRDYSPNRKRSRSAVAAGFGTASSTDAFSGRERASAGSSSEFAPERRRREFFDQDAQPAHTAVRVHADTSGAVHEFGDEKPVREVPESRSPETLSADTQPAAEAHEEKAAITAAPKNDIPEKTENPAAEAVKPAAAPEVFAKPEIRLSADGKPMIAVPFVNDDGSTSTKWLEVVVPEKAESEESGTTAVPVPIPVPVPSDDSDDVDEDDEDELDDVELGDVVYDLSDFELDDMEDEDDEDEEDEEDNDDAVDFAALSYEAANSWYGEDDVEEDEDDEDDEIEFAESISPDALFGVSYDENDDDEDDEDDVDYASIVYSDDDLFSDDEEDEEDSDEEEAQEEKSADDSSDEDDEEDEEDSDEEEAQEEKSADDSSDEDGEENADSEQDGNDDDTIVLGGEDESGDSEDLDDDNDDDFDGEDFDGEYFDYDDDDDDGDEELDFASIEIGEDEDSDTDSDEDEDNSDEDEDNSDEDEDNSDEDEDIKIAPDPIRRTLSAASFAMHDEDDEDEDNEDDIKIFSSSSARTDELFVRQNHPDGSTAVFDIPKGVKLPSYIDDDEFLEQWLNESDDDMANISKKTKRKISTILGASTLVLALIGLGFILLTLFNSLQSCNTKTSKNSEYVDFVMPAVYTDIAPFETWEAISKDKLLDCCLVGAIDNAATPYPTDDNNRSLVPTSDVLASAKRLFGEAATIDIESLASSLAIEVNGYYYDDLNDVFHVEQSGFGDVEAEVIGSPKVKSDSVEFEVGYKSASAILEDSSDDQSYFKTMQFILIKNEDGSYYIAKLREVKAD